MVPHDTDTAGGILNPTQAKPENEPAHGVPIRLIILGAAVYISTGFIIALFFKSARDFLFDYRLGVALVVGAALIALVIAQLRGSLKQSLPATRAQIFMFGVLPALLLAVGSVIELPGFLQIIAIQGIFLVIVCILPAIMWYLFVVTRKFSL